MKNVFKKAYTLAEVIIVMLIIAVVVSVTIKLTKAKLDNITSYTYYSAYNTVRAVAVEMVRDFDPEEDDYGVTNGNIALKIKNFFASNFGICRAWGAGCIGGCPSGWRCDTSTGTCMKPTTPFNPEIDNSEITPVDPNGYTKEMYCMNMNLSAETNAKPIWKSPQCGYYCTSEGYMKPKNPPLAACSAGYYRTGVDDSPACTCVPYSDPDPEPTPTPEPEPTPTPTPEPTPTCPDPSQIPCGQECNASTGFLVRDIAGFQRSCPDRAHQWSEEQCGCIPAIQTVSRSGEGFCRLFVNYSNTARLAEDDECQGDQINNGETDFADKEPDMILRNGMILYNVSQDPEPIAELAGNSKGVTYIDSQNREVDVDTWGYKLYVDIDGLRGGNGTLWEDVYPFYVTLSGTVIPAYDIDNPETAGGDSRLHLQTSVYDEFVDANGRHTQWITKSTTFKESACKMGYVNPATPYCQGIAGNNQCAQQNHDCRIKTVMPVKFFGF